MAPSSCLWFAECDPRKPKRHRRIGTQHQRKKEKIHPQTFRNFWFPPWLKQQTNPRCIQSIFKKSSGRPRPNLPFLSKSRNARIILGNHAKPLSICFAVKTQCNTILWYAMHHDSLRRNALRLKVDTLFFLQNLHAISIYRNTFYAAVFARNEIVFGKIFIAEGLNNSAFYGADGVAKGFVIGGIETGL